jgi:hypothetical protein
MISSEDAAATKLIALCRRLAFVESRGRLADGSRIDGTEYAERTLQRANFGPFPPAWSHLRPNTGNSLYIPS